jgi:UDP-N-acetylglucosamine 2-epimerase (hydrolysing)
MKKIAFLTGTRADYGKIKPLITSLKKLPDFEISILVTGMHLLKNYGSTYNQIVNDNLGTIHLIPNQHSVPTMENNLAMTIEKVSSVCSVNNFDLLIVHGDRIEALAGAIVGVLRNLPVAHIEGGEVSGTVDGLIRHSVSKLSHLHFVSSEAARRRLLQLGERETSIFNIGSPDIDVMLSSQLPNINEVKVRYEIPFDKYGILIFHPITNEVNKIQEISKAVCEAVNLSNKKYVVIKPNNDLGTEVVQHNLQNLSDPNRFIHIPSMRFEYFLQLLKNAEFIIGNSSAGVREAAYFGIPAINIGTRQLNRNRNSLIVDSDYEINQILQSISLTERLQRSPIQDFGEGKSGELFFSVMTDKDLWPIDTNKVFIDLEEGVK